MPTKNLVNAQEYIDRKMEWILNTFLGGAIDQFNADQGWTGDKALRKPLQNYINVSAVPLAQLLTNPIDTLNAIVINKLSSTTNDDNLIEDRDVVDVFEVTAVYATDYGKIDWASKQTRYLALMAEQVLEAYLIDQAGDPNGCVVYNTRLITSGASQVIPLQGQDTYLNACSCQLEVSYRANIEWSPSLINPDLPNLPWFAHTFRPPTMTLETDLAVPLGSASPNTTNALTITAGDLAAATDIVINTGTWENGSKVYVANLNAGQTSTGTIAAGQVTIPLASIRIQDGDLWTITPVNLSTNTPAGYPIQWSVV